MKRHLTVLAVAAAMGAAFLLRHINGSQSATLRPVPSVTLLLTLGERAEAVERWDGSAHVTNGALLATEDRQFSAGDAITGPGAWKCATRRDEVAPYADIHYTEMRPGEKPPVLFHPVGIYLSISRLPETKISVHTTQGNFEFALSAIGLEPSRFLNGRASAVIVPSVERLSAPEYDADEPCITAAPDGRIAAAWVAYRNRADRIFMRVHQNGSWSPAEEVTLKPADIFRCSVAADNAGNLWLFWSERDGDAWRIQGRQRKAGVWQNPIRLSDAGSSAFHRAASSPNGEIYLVWQSFRDGQSDIYMKTWRAGTWSDEIRVSDSPSNDWEPAVAAAADGSAYVAWDSYDRGNYDIYFRSWSNGALGSQRAVTSSPRFQAHASVAVDNRNRPWVAWDESGVNWAKDQGFLIPTPLSVPIHQQRNLRVAVWEPDGWRELRQKPVEVFPLEMRENSEHPQLAFDGIGTLTLLFRKWSRRNARTIGSPLAWDNYVTYLRGDRWTTPQPIAHSGGSIEKCPALARDASGDLWAVWMTDNRPFTTLIPRNAGIYYSRLGSVISAPLTAQALSPFTEPSVEAILIHNNETEDVKTVRNYRIANGGKQYRIYRGDMHRHTDVSQDFKYDGSLLELYRYAVDAAAFDYIAATDHQAGFDQEFTWWQNQKLVDVFLIPGFFTPLYAYERSVPFPNGHRNVIFDHRGVRTLPVPPEEASGATGASKLYAYLQQNGGISMPHSSATNQGTDWRDNDREVEPLVEIYQGYRNSYEYEGAPRSATALNPQAQKSGWQPSGFWWNALAKGYKLGVQSSSDHWSTHISYACLIADSFTRAGLLDAIRKRHAYGATDNIILDFRARSGSASYLMGDAFAADAAPQLSVRAIGTGVIRQIDLIKNRTFLYTTRPGTKQASFEFTDKDFNSGESYYYVRVLQEDGQLAWSSPIWMTK